MKKSLFILPLAAAVLGGCLPGGKKTDTSGGPTVTGDTGVDLGPSEYQGYRRVQAAPTDGKEYIMGMYQANRGENMFYNGGPHTDANGEYPFYLSCTTDVSKATKIKIKYTDDKHFTMQDVGGGELSRYKDQYLRVYESLKDTGNITSLSFFDGTEEGAKVDPGNPSHVVTHSNDQFEFVESYNHGGEVHTLNTFGSWLATEGYAAQPVVFGTYNDYISIGAVTPNHFGTNYLTFLWEKI